MCSHKVIYAYTETKVTKITKNTKKLQHKLQQNKCTLHANIANVARLILLFPFLLQDWLHGFPGLFTDTSEHIRLF